MSRRIALALSFSLTIVVTFALVSFASQAGWLEAKSGGDEEAAVIEPQPSPTAEPTVQQEPRVITEYVYVDVPVGAPPAQQAADPPATPTPQPTAVPQQSSPNTGSAISVQPSQSEQPTQPARSPSTSGPTSRSAEPEDDEDEHEEEHEHEEHEEHEDDD